MTLDEFIRALRAGEIMRRVAVADEKGVWDSLVPLDASEPPEVLAQFAGENGVFADSVTEEEATRLVTEALA